MLGLQQAIKAISDLESHMIRITRNAESQVATVSLELNGDGSGRVVFKWTQRVCSGASASKSEQGLLNFIATVNADADLAETSEIFDSIEDLEAFLRENRVLSA